MQSRKNIVYATAGVALVAIAASIVASASSWIDRPFAGFLLLENGVVASAGLADWPAANEGRVFQHRLISYDGARFESPAAFETYIESQPAGTDIIYEFARGTRKIEATIATREFTRSDALLLFGASLVCAIAFLSVAGALLFMAPKDPASLGTALSFGITGVFALTALDLYGPYRFFRVHAVAECFLGAGMLHMALAFPYRRRLLQRFPWLIPSAYFGATALGLTTALFLHEPSVYVETHRIAVLAAGVSFLAMVVSQIAAYVKPINYAARKRVEILALGTVASVTPAFALLVSSALSGGGAAENLMGWAGIFFPISVAYAVLRADALEVDAIVRRTVSYAILTVIVGAAYAGLIGGLETLVRDQDQGPRWLTVLIFSCFCTFGVLPLRDVVQSGVDKLFFRSVYDFRRTIEGTSAVLARLTALDEIRERIEDAVSAALQPESVELIVDTNDPCEADIDDGGEISHAAIVDLESGGIAIPFQSSNRVVARLVLGRRLSGRFYAGEDRALLQILANQGAISIENALALERLNDLNLTLEKRVRDRTAELARTVEELTETQVQLVQAERLAAVGELAAGVAHEVNNPLNFARNSLRTLAVLVDELSSYAGAVGTLDLDNAESLVCQAKQIAIQFEGLDAGELAEDVKELVGILGSGLDRTAQLVADLRDFASPQSQENGPFDLAECVRATLELTGSALRDANIELDLDIEDDIPKAFGDASSMNQVILNLVKNSIDALEGRNRGRLGVSIYRSDREGLLVLSVDDNGVGIASDVAPRIFEPFFTTKEAGKGTGLGLAMCQRVIQEYDGEIRIESTPSKGTKAIVQIPAAIDC